MEELKTKIEFPTDDLVKDYGYVPFKNFQYVVLFLIILSFIFRDHIVKALNKHVYSTLDKYIKNQTLLTIVKSLIAIIPTIILAYYDLRYRSFSMKNLKVTNIIPNIQINNILRLLGAYVIIQVAAQDIGVRTGDVQSDVTKLQVLQYFLYVGGAYALTQDRSLAIIAGILYFQLKFFASARVKDVCFEE
jgi:hypothetical protein